MCILQNPASYFMSTTLGGLVIMHFFPAKDFEKNFLIPIDNN